MPDLKSVDDLVVPGAIERYKSATHLGMWAHIPLNAFRVYREEVLGRQLFRHGIELDKHKYMPEALDIYQAFVVDNAHILSALSEDYLASDSSGCHNWNDRWMLWPCDSYLDQVVANIGKLEDLRKTRLARAIGLLNEYGLNGHAVLNIMAKDSSEMNDNNSIMTQVSQWIYSSLESTEGLESTFAEAAAVVSQQRRFDLLTAMIRNHPEYQVSLLIQNIFEFPFERDSFLMSSGMSCAIGCSPLFREFVQRRVDYTPYNDSGHSAAAPVDIMQAALQVIENIRMIYQGELSKSVVRVVTYYFHDTLFE